MCILVAARKARPSTSLLILSLLVGSASKRDLRTICGLGDQHLCQSRPSCTPLGPALRSGLAHVLLPDLVLPSWLISSMSLETCVVRQMGCCLSWLGTFSELFEGPLYFCICSFVQKLPLYPRKYIKCALKCIFNVMGGRDVPWEILNTKMK